ncbi:unnamed protein product [Adineta ricciae]|uniref:DUF4200 domain-containing protein n=1 Tax=Adineta ricciae TaxID=249248 RepID=A0A814SI39_ADIRI|nr:unnamed protein product [Adineta ricciae]
MIETSHSVLFDLCDWQKQERQRRLHKRGNNDQKLCDIETAESDPEGFKSNQLLTDIDREWIIKQTQNRRGERNSLRDYLRKNHELFILQYTINVKRNEIERLEKDLRREEHALIKSEKYIMEDLALFDQFLDAWNRNASDAAARADEESMKKEELINEIKRLEKTLLTCQNDRNHLIDLLRQSRRHQQFLFKFAPEGWRSQILNSIETEHNRSIDAFKHTANSNKESILMSPEDYSLYFTQPDQLLEIFTEMEEKSLPLVEKSQHTSEVLDRIHSTTITTQTEQDHQVEQLQLKINHLKDLINHEIEREITCKNLFTQYKTMKDNPFNDQLKQAIEQLYKKYIISDDVGLSTHSMLQAVESKIQNLFHIIEQMNSTDIVEAEKSRQMMVRWTRRQEKVHQEKLANETKQQKALLRSSAPPYVKVEEENVLSLLLFPSFSDRSNNNGTITSISNKKIL